MWRLWCGVIGIAVAVAVAGNGRAAAQTADPGGTIIVNGVRQSPEEIRRRAMAFVRAMGVATDQTPAARWTVPVCPKVIGIGSHYADIVEAKMRDIATAAHVPLAKAPCRGNAAVIFVPDSKALIEQLVARQPARFGRMTDTQRKALIDKAAPISWWYNSERRTKDGSAATEIPAGLVGGVVGTGESVVGSSADSEAFQQVGSSIIGTRVVRGITQASVVIDLNRADGATLGAVAAYAALVAFAEVTPATPPPADSILALFRAGDRPRDLTALDAAFLRSLYKLPLDREARVHRNLLIRDVAASGEDR